MSIGVKCRLCLPNRIGLFRRGVRRFSPGFIGVVPLFRIRSEVALEGVIERVLAVGRAFPAGRISNFFNNSAKPWPVSGLSVTLQGNSASAPIQEVSSARTRSSTPLTTSSTSI
jgi:hypothetical protein